MNDPFNIEKTAPGTRVSGRDSLLLKAILRFPASGSESEVRIRNLSAGGLMAESPARIARGEVVELHMRNIGWITGHVAWVAEGRMGIAFDHPINPKEARKPVGVSELELPPYLKKLNNPAGPRRS